MQLVRHCTALILALRKPIVKLQTESIGSSDTGLGHPNDGGKGFDSTMANVITDAMLEATRKMGSVAAFANQGGIRSSLEPGTITYGEAIGVAPFGNTLVTLELTGEELKRALEHGAKIGASPALHARQRAVEAVHVAAADPAGLHAHQHITGTDLRLRHVRQFQFQILLHQESTHQNHRLPPRKRRTRSTASIRFSYELA